VFVYHITCNLLHFYLTYILHLCLFLYFAAVFCVMPNSASELIVCVCVRVCVRCKRWRC